MTAPIRIDVIRQDTSETDFKRLRCSRATCHFGGVVYRSDGPAPIYKLATLLWLDGRGGVPFEVYDDRSPTGGPGGLALRGTVRNFSRIKGKAADFRWEADSDPDITAVEAKIVLLAAGQMSI